MSLKEALYMVQAELLQMRYRREHRLQVCSGTGSEHKWLEVSEFGDFGWYVSGYACQACDDEISLPIHNR